MTDATIRMLVWLGFGVQLVVGLAVLRHLASARLLPLLNLLLAALVLIYWGQRWYTYLFRGITWYASDQLLPLYALVVAVVAGLTLSGRYPGTVFHWVVFGIHTVVLLLAVLFVTFFRMNRLV